MISCGFRGRTWTHLCLLRSRVLLRGWGFWWTWWGICRFRRGRTIILTIWGKNFWSIRAMRSDLMSRLKGLMMDRYLLNCMWFCSMRFTIVFLIIISNDGLMIILQVISVMSLNCVKNGWSGSWWRTFFLDCNLFRFGFRCLFGNMIQSSISILIEDYRNLCCAELEEARSGVSDDDSWTCQYYEES